MLSVLGSTKAVSFRIKHHPELKSALSFIQMRINYKYSKYEIAFHADLNCSGMCSQLAPHALARALASTQAYYYTGCLVGCVTNSFRNITKIYLFF